MRSGARKLRTAFTAGRLTHFGGIYLVHRFLQQLKLRSYLHQHITFSQRNQHYSLSELLLALMYPMILGLEKIEVSALLNSNGVFRHITGLPRFPNPTTFRRFLIRAAPVVLPQLQATHDQLRRYFLTQPTLPSSFWLDCDSTVRTLYGHQEGAEIGYNPEHKGHRSYHPLVITEAKTGDCLAGRLRPGNAHTADGIDELLNQVLVVLPHHQNLRLRADAGFYSGDFITRIKHDTAFVVVAQVTPALRKTLPGRRYHTVVDGIATASFKYQPWGWPQSERFMALRRTLPTDEDEQTTLLQINRYTYAVVVTNLLLTPHNVFRFYRGRAGQERIIRTLKDDYPFGSAPTRSFAANELYAELSLLAYNLMTWFKRLCLPADWQSFTLPTIRYRLLLLPGEFVTTSNIPTLRFPRSSPHQEVFKAAHKKISRLKPLI